MDTPEGPPVRGTPSGPVERMEWLDALEELKLRVKTLERFQRDQAGHIAESSSNMDRMAGKLLETQTVVETDAGKLAEVDRKLGSAANVIESQYVTLDRLQAHEAQILSFSNELQTLMNVCADLNARYVELSSRPAPCPGPASAPTMPENFNLAVTTYSS